MKRVLDWLMDVDWQDLIKYPLISMVVFAVLMSIFTYLMASKTIFGVLWLICTILWGVSLLIWVACFIMVRLEHCNWNWNWHERRRNDYEEDDK